MFGLISRYVLWEVARTFLLSVTLLTGFFTLIGGAKQGLDAGLSPLFILQIFPFVLPEMLRFTIPGALLFAVSTVYGRAAANNEIIAVKSLGIHPLKMIWPALILAFYLSLLTFWLYDVCAWWGRPQMRQVIMEAVEEIVCSNLEANRAFSAPQFTIAVQEMDDSRLVEPIIVVNPRGNLPQLTITAREAWLKADPAEAEMTLVCRDGEVEVEGGNRFVFDDVLKQEIPFDSYTPGKVNFRRPATLAGIDIPKYVASQQQTIAELETELAKNEFVKDQQKQQVQQLLKREKQTLARLQTEPHRRWANGFTCLCFAVLAVPVSVMGRKRDFLTSFFYCMLPILVFYYPLLVVGEQAAASGTIPAYGVWLPDVLFAIIGGYLLYRALRY